MNKILMCIFFSWSFDISVFVIKGYHCQVNCKCEEYWASCNLVTCDDEILTDAPLISIYERLCPQYYTLLSHEEGAFTFNFMALIVMIFRNASKYLFKNSSNMCK